MDKITSELWEPAARSRAVEISALQGRLDRGEEIDLCDAVSLFEIRARDQLWKLSHLTARGRIGGPCEPFSDIPATAWSHLRWKFLDLEFLAETPEAELIYDIQLRSTGIAEWPAAENVTLPINEPACAGCDDASRPTHDRSAAFLEIIEAKAPAGPPLGVANYRQMLARFGLGMSDKGRVAGVTVADGGPIVASPGSPGIDLDKALMVTRLLRDRDHFSRFENRYAVSRALCAWILDQHPNIPGVGGQERVSDAKVDRFARQLLARSLF